MRGQHPENKVQDVSDISGTLKIIAKDLSLPVIALSQLNRNIEHRHDKTPQLSGFSWQCLDNHASISNDPESLQMHLNGSSKR